MNLLELLMEPLEKTTLALQSVLQLKQGDKIYLQKGLEDYILFEN